MKVVTIITGSLEENCFLLINEKHDCLIIDPGADADKIINKIIHLELKPVAILLTHAHFDHIGAVNTLIKKYNIVAYMHQLDEQLAVEQLGDIGIISVVELQNEYASEKIENYTLFNDEIIIDGFDIIVHHLPGHTQGSVAFEIKNENILFTGDFLFKGTIGRTDLKYSDPRQMLASVKYAKTFSPDLVVYPGHGESTTMKHELATNHYFLKY